MASASVYHTPSTRLTLDSSFDDIFSDFIDCINDQSGSNFNAAVDSKSSPHQNGSGALYELDTSKSADMNFENLLYNALTSYLSDSETSSTEPQKSSSPQPQPSTSRPHTPIEKAQVSTSSDLSLANPSSWEVSALSPLYASSEHLFTTSALDIALPSPPQSPSLSSPIHVSDYHPSLTSSQEDLSDQKYTFDFSQLSSPFTSPKMSTVDPQQHSLQNWAKAEHPKISSFTTSHYESSFPSPPTSACYQGLIFNQNSGHRIDTPLPTGYGAQPNTPVEDALFNESNSYITNHDLGTWPQHSSSHGIPVSIGSAMPFRQPFSSTHNQFGPWSQTRGFAIPIFPSRAVVAPHHYQKTHTGNVPKTGFANNVNSSGHSFQSQFSDPSELSRHTVGGSKGYRLNHSRSRSQGTPRTQMSPLFISAALPQSPSIISPKPLPPRFDAETVLSKSLENSVGHQSFNQMSPPKQRTRSPQISHRRTKSSGHNRRKSAGGSSKSPRHASFDFVNLTSKDSSTLLTGVAPSGSSKTKARREKEAADRRRRAHEAAKRAVEQAGGDVHTFENILHSA